MQRAFLWNDKIPPANLKWEPSAIELRNTNKKLESAEAETAQGEEIDVELLHKLEYVSQLIPSFLTNELEGDVICAYMEK